MLRTIAHHGMVYRLGPGLAATGMTGEHDARLPHDLASWNALPTAAARLLCRWLNEGTTCLTLAGLERLRTAAGLTEFEIGLAIAQLADRMLVIISPHATGDASAAPSNRAA